MEVHAAQIGNNPRLHEFTVTDLPADSLGQHVHFKLQVRTNGGYSAISTKHSSVLVADTPSTPLKGPERNDLLTSTKQLALTITEPENGGTVLTNFEV